MAYQLDMTTARLFVAVIEEKSIAAAARRENIVPSAVSKRISELEQRLGHVLIRRHAAGVDITPTGSLVLRRARNLMHEADLLTDELAQLSAGVEGHVRIAASETTLIGYMPEILGDFMRAHQSIRVDLDERANADVVMAIEQHGADLGIYTGDTPAGELWVRPCFRDQIVAVMRREHPLARLSGVTLLQLLDYEIIGDHERGALSVLLSQQAAACGQTVRVRVRARGFDLACRLVQQGLGITIVAESTSLLLAAEAMELVTRPVLEPWARRQHRVCVRQPGQLPTAVRLMLSHILCKQENAGIDLS